MDLFNNPKPLVIVDGFAVFFRAYYAFDPIINKDNININALYGFFNILLRLERTFSDHDMCIALDCGKKTFRDSLFSEYKSNRQETPEDLKPQFPILHEALKHSSITHFSCEGFEADDIIATMTKAANKNNRHVIIVSLDKDLAQLLKYNNVCMYDFSKRKKVNHGDIVEKFGIMPKYIADYLALVGDSADNIPGVRSIGPKTAADLINTYGDIDQIYSNIESISRQSVKKSLQTHREDAFLSKKLATLCEDMKEIPHIEEIKFNSIDQSSLKEFTAKHGF